MQDAHLSVIDFPTSPTDHFLDLCTAGVAAKPAEWSAFVDLSRASYFPIVLQNDASQ